jgi:nucleoside phosphorylase
MSWRESLQTLQKQFEAHAERSGGLHHLFVEVADDERDRMKGPDWFVRESHVDSTDIAALRRGGRWHVVYWSGLPTIHPRFREIKPEEGGDDYSGKRVIRDRSGLPRALFEPMRLRQSYLCGDHNTLDGFKALADAASHTLCDVNDLAGHEFADDLTDLFRQPRGGIRYIFGEVNDPPRNFVARAWDAGVLLYEHGVLIDMPIAEDVPSVGHWLLLLHRLSWRRLPGSPLHGERLAWHENTTVPLEWIVNNAFDAAMPDQWRYQFSQISTTSYYSLLGAMDQPLDVNLASAFAIQLLLHTKSEPARATGGGPNVVDYSKETWHRLRLPTLAEDTLEQCRESINPRIVLLTATSIERDTVLKHLEPPENCTCVLRVFYENNVFFIGKLGVFPVVLCMCEMGSSGRDSAHSVASEAIQVWEPKAVVSLGIAFGRDRTRQKIGDVLVADSVLSYEPCRVGPEDDISRTRQYHVSPMLLSRFKNMVDWSFLDPSGAACGVHFGPVLSGEKLVDNADFKEKLFAAHQNAIGGEMEGIGLAAAAERSRCHCDWILVKGICDWADGNKDGRHQEFAAASATNLVRHVLCHPMAIPT